jgi:hypothetical protein
MGNGKQRKALQRDRQTNPNEAATPGADVAAIVDGAAGLAIVDEDVGADSAVGIEQVEASPSAGIEQAGTSVSAGIEQAGVRPPDEIDPGGKSRQDF